MSKTQDQIFFTEKSPGFEVKGDGTKWNGGGGGGGEGGGKVQGRNEGRRQEEAGPGAQIQERKPPCSLFFIV